MSWWNAPPWRVMWTLAFAIYCGCKGLTWWRRPPVDGVGAPAWKHAAYLLTWPGLDADAFLRGRADEPPPGRAEDGERVHQVEHVEHVERVARTEWIRGFANLAVGVTLFFGVARLVAPRSDYVAGWLGMIGVVQTLHFGTFQLLSCLWCRAGVDARPLMNRPVLSTSLGEFWGRRWNTAFRDLTHRFLFRPMTRRFGVRGGLAAGFVFSGLVHDLVISVPAGGGYGGPTIFFALQGAGILIERSRGRFARSLGLGSGARGRLFTMLLLILPAPILFHPPFITRIVIPFMRALGAL